jgi:hypothetical protein
MATGTGAVDKSTQHLAQVGMFKSELGRDTQETDIVEFTQPGMDPQNDGRGIDDMMGKIRKIEVRVSERTTSLSQEQQSLQQDEGDIVPSLYKRLTGEVVFIAANNDKLGKRLEMILSTQQHVAYLLADTNLKGLGARISGIQTGGGLVFVHSIKALERHLASQVMAQKVHKRGAPVDTSKTTSTTSSSSSSSSSSTTSSSRKPPSKGTSSSSTATTSDSSKEPAKVKTSLTPGATSSTSIKFSSSSLVSASTDLTTLSALVGSLSSTPLSTSVKNGGMSSSSVTPPPASSSSPAAGKGPDSGTASSTMTAPSLTMTMSSSSSTSTSTSSPTMEKGKPDNKDSSPVRGKKSPEPTTPPVGGEEEDDEEEEMSAADKVTEAQKISGKIVINKAVPKDVVDEITELLSEEELTGLMKAVGASINTIPKHSKKTLEELRKTAANQWKNYPVQVKSFLASFAQEQQKLAATEVEEEEDEVEGASST